MERDEYVAQVRAGYAALGEGHYETAFELIDEHVVMHIAGDHPLSGTYRGKSGLLAYMDAMVAASEGSNAYTVVSVMVDEVTGGVLVEGTAVHGTEQPFVRTIVHQLRFEDGRVVEVWQRPFDQAAEDQFWRSAMPTRRET
ncbi:MAG: nuclear transport factor 2 family protein [Mycetocola sp.]